VKGVQSTRSRRPWILRLYFFFLAPGVLWAGGFVLACWGFHWPGDGNNRTNDSREPGRGEKAWQAARARRQMQAGMQQRTVASSDDLDACMARGVWVVYYDDYNCMFNLALCLHVVYLAWKRETICMVICANTELLCEQCYKILCHVINHLS
jgi:hypothetical protein